jgi:predicted ATPase
LVLRAGRQLGVGASIDDLPADLVRVTRASFVFHHPLVRSAVYQSGVTSERRVAHLALASVLEGRESDLDRRAWHLAEAAQEPDEEVAAELERRRPGPPPLRPRLGAGGGAEPGRRGP